MASPLPTPARDPLQGTPYVTVGFAGRGGMGEVFLALHRGLNKPVVVKLLHRQFADDVRFADRLRVEAQALAAVSSPHVVTVSDLGCTPEGRPYLVLERLRGRTLRDELRERRALPIGEAVAITRQILEGLHAAHLLGIVHRDVKADNIFLCQDPSGSGAPLVKVLDFGIAKVLDTSSAEPALAGPQYPTEEGVMVGSPRTVAPEQIRFQPVDARTDVYAVGLLLYTMIAGRPPFVYARDLLKTLDAHLTEVPRAPSMYALQAVPAALDHLILKALAKRPEHRFPSAEGMAEELALVLHIEAPVSGARPLHVANVGARDVTASREAEEEAWFAPPAWVSRVVEEPAHHPPMPVVPLALDSGEVRTFVVLTLASTALFSVLVALAWRLIEAR